MDCQIYDDNVPNKNVYNLVSNNNVLFKYNVYNSRNFIDMLKSVYQVTDCIRISIHLGESTG